MKHKKKIQKTMRKLRKRIKKMETRRKRGLKSKAAMSGGTDTGAGETKTDTEFKTKIETMETELKTKMDEFTKTLETEKNKINDATKNIIPSIVTAIETINTKLKTLTTEDQEKFYTTQFVVSNKTPEANTEGVGKTP